jgi:DNA end-binding protein Ku
MIEEKIDKGDAAEPAPAKTRRPTNVVDLVSVLQQSIQQTKAKGKPAPKAAAKSAPAKAAAKPKAAKSKKAA